MKQTVDFKSLFLWVALATALSGWQARSSLAIPQVDSTSAIVPDVVRIWDSAEHNAFTGLIQHQDVFYCTFREATSHVPRNHAQDGRIRIISSRDADHWESFDLVQVEGVDLRDPKLSVTPRGELMLLMGGSHYESGKLLKRQPLVALLEPGENRFRTPEPVVVDEAIRTSTDWLWRVTWRGDTGYGVVYQPTDTEPWGLQLVSTTDGINFAHLKTFDLPGRPNESTVRFDSEGQMLIVVRNENQQSQLGISPAPYTEWTWKEIPQRLGGPDLIQLPGGEWILGTRIYGTQPATVLHRMTLDGSLTELVRFPSGGDTSYPGLLLVDDQLWVSYYSSHEGKSSIYLARIPVDKLTSNPDSPATSTGKNDP